MALAPFFVLGVVGAAVANLDVPYEAGRLTAGMAFNVLITGSIARGSSRRWRWWRFVLVAMGVGLALTCLRAASALSSGVAT